jgi:hypothetical protein
MERHCLNIENKEKMAIQAHFLPDAPMGILMKSDV